MQFTFGLQLDGRTWPGVLDGRTAVAGESWGGPIALLNTLEGQLGLATPDTPKPLRAAKLISKLDVEGAFWQQSALADPLATAMQLIRWDEELRLHGWLGEPVSARLEQLAALISTIQPGFARRYEIVVDLLPEHSTDVETIEISGCARDALPKLYRRLLDALEAKGCEIRERTIDPADGAGDLVGCLNQDFSPEGTGELQLTRPLGPITAADAVAVWLAQLDGLSGTVIIGSDEVLDAALLRHGVPVLGARCHTGADSLLQILPLIISLGWHPQDPDIALELLTLPETPVPASIARRLDKALREWPAVASKTWVSELQAGLDAIEDRGRRRGVKKRLSVLLKGTVKGNDYPMTEIERRLDALSGWIRGRKDAEGNGDARWSDVLEQVAAFRRLCTEIESTTLSRPLLGCLLRHATEQVGTRSLRQAEAGLISVVGPAAVIGPARRIVWWSFTERVAPTVRQLPLTPEERKKLEAIGSALPDPGEQAEQLGLEWRRPLQMATEAVLLVCPQFGRDGTPEAPHPLWDEITSGLSSAQEARLISELPTNVAAERVLPALPIPQPRKQWTVARPETIRLPEHFSPTSMNKLIANPLYWVLECSTKLSSGRGERLPQDVLMMGRLAHDIIGRILSCLRDGETITPEDAADRSDKLFVSEGPIMAAEFFVPGRERECAELRRRIVDATRGLFRHLGETRATVAAVEEMREANVDGVALKGQPDLELANPDAILDIKWSGAVFRREELARGGASQLAIYSQLTKQNACIGYYIIREHLLMVTGGSIQGADPVNGPSAAETWAGVKRALANRLEELARGIVVDTCADVEGNDLPRRNALENGMLVIVPKPEYSSFSWASIGEST